jgi:hypothetical protein
MDLRPKDPSFIPRTYQHDAEDERADRRVLKISKACAVAEKWFNLSPYCQHDIPLRLSCRQCGRQALEWARAAKTTVLYLSQERLFVATGEWRPPRAGEFYACFQEIVSKGEPCYDDRHTPTIMRAAVDQDTATFIVIPFHGRVPEAA